MDTEEVRLLLIKKLRNRTKSENHEKNVSSIMSSLQDLEILKLAMRGASLDEAEKILGYKIDGVFLVHPRGEADLRNKYDFFKTLSREKIREIQEAHWPTVLDIVHYEQMNIPVWSLPLTPEYFFPQTDRETKRHFQEVSQKKKEEALILLKFFESEGKIPIILGALTGRIARFLKKQGIQSPLITGIYLTPCFISGMIKKIAVIAKEIALEYRIALVGGAGNMGQAILNWLVAEGFQNITVIEASNAELNSIQNKYETEIAQQCLYLTTNIEAVREKDIVIVATASPRILVKADMLSAGTIIIDDTHPSNVAKDVIGDKIAVLRVMAKAPKLKYNFPMDQMSDNETVTCLAEGVLMVAIGNTLMNAYNEVCVLNTRECQLKLMKKVAQKGRELDIGFADFRDYDNYISNERVKKVRSLKNE